MFKESLKTRIKVFFLLVGLVPMILSSLQFLFIIKSTLREVVQRNLQTQAESTSKDITQLMVHGYSGIKALADNFIIASSTAGKSEKTLEMQRIQEFYKLYDRITLADPEGVVIASTRPDSSQNRANQGWFGKARDQKVFVSDLYFSEPSQAVLVFAAPVVNSENKVLYVIDGQVPLEHIWSLMSKAKIGQSGYMILIDKTGKVLAHPDKDLLLKPLKAPELIEGLLYGNFTRTSYPLSKGTRVLAASSPLSGEVGYVLPEWFVIAVEPENEAFALVKTVQRWAWILIGTGLLFILPLSIGLARSIMEPIQALVAGAQGIARGDLRSRVKINSRDELGTLSRVFNEMAEALENYTKNLEQRIQDRTLELQIEREKAEDRAQNLIVINKIFQVITATISLEKILQLAVATVGRVLKASQCSLMFVEESSGHLCSRYESRYESYQKKSQTNLIDVLIRLEYYPELKKAIKTRKPVAVEDIQNDPILHEVRHRLTHLDIRSILVFPLTSKDKVLGLLVLRWRKEVHAFTKEEIRLGEILANQIAIALKNAQLFAKERRLERMKAEFTRIIVHDLKNPLAAITGLSELLLRKVVKEHRAQDEQYLRNILYYAHLLLEMVHNILEVYKMEEGALKLQEEVVQLLFLAQEATQQFEILVQQEGITLTLEIPEDLPPIRVDKRIFIRVLANILHNAIKHTRRGGKITLRAERLGAGEMCIKIQDTGVGIPAEYIHKIFEKFVQIERRKTEATVSVGLGLYFCKLAMEAHGGQIQVESQEGVGSTFHLILPPDRIVE